MNEHDKVMTQDFAERSAHHRNARVPASEWPNLHSMIEM
jgi:hypothetical protein